MKLVIHNDEAVRDFEGRRLDTSHQIKTPKGVLEFEKILRYMMGATSSRNYRLTTNTVDWFKLSNESGQCFRYVNLRFIRLDNKKYWTMWWPNSNFLRTFEISAEQIYETVKKILAEGGSLLVEPRRYNGDPDCGKEVNESKKLWAQRMPHLFAKDWQYTIEPINCDTMGWQ